MFRLFGFLIIFFVVLISCFQSGKIGKAGVEYPNETLKDSGRYFSIISPSDAKILKTGELVSIKVALIDTFISPDSIQILVNNHYVGHILPENSVFSWNTFGESRGYKQITVLLFCAGRIFNESCRIFISSPLIPIQYIYHVNNSLPHDTGAYTQGFFYRNGYFFESTGQMGQSSVRKVKLATGEMVRAVNSVDTVFGEGLCFINNELIQLTWKSKTAYIYDTLLNLKRSVHYTINEGWGLTTDGKSLIMSDGSPNLYFLHKETLALQKTVVVSDNNGPVDQLNELEFVEGNVWANVFTSDSIVQINPETGDVIGQISFSGIIKSSERNRNIDVLNGIAYDSISRRLFITGKNWPKVFEVSIHQK